ncbi:MAG TPA: CDP-diacylglycerol diphosphatase [Steroidobacteraceae bacterium]|nr:CDP-diacylglycerol diphosphatase [Steroidobacteraceae bacterium]
MALSCAIGAALIGINRPAQAARDDLQRIVQRQCLPDWLQRHDPAPCLAVQVRASAAVKDAGYALLADRKGGAHFLLIPLRTLSGIESPALLRPDAPNYFAAAWDARAHLLPGALRLVPDEDVGLAVNSHFSRGQDQLHIHIECQGEALHAKLQAAAPQLSTHWMPLEVDGDTYLVRRVLGGTLQGADPVRLLAEGLPAARAHMGYYTLVVAGVQFRDGAGFALLTRRAVLRGGERLLDNTCAVAAEAAAPARPN